MASPFSIFRKHQRWLMAVVGVMCMLAFTVLGSVQLGMQGGPNSDDPVVVTSKYGDWRQSDLQLMAYQRRMVGDFMNETADFMHRDVMTMRRSNNLVKVLEAAQILRMTAREYLEFNEEELVNLHILARQAQDMGIIVGDDAVKAYLGLATRYTATDEQFNEALAKMRRERKAVSTNLLYDAIRVQLLARQMMAIFSAAAEASTPAERWEYYQRLNQGAKIELVAFPAVDKVNEIADPTEATLKEFFAKYRDQEPQPGSPEPGFKIPRRAAFDYFVAKWDDFYDPKAITDAEILAYYEKEKKTQFRFQDFGLREYDETPEQEPEKEAAQGDKTPEGEKPADTDKPAKDAKPADTPPAEPKADASSPPTSQCGDGEADELSCSADEETSPPVTEPATADEPSTSDQPVSEKPATADAPASGDKSAADPAETDPQPAVPAPTTAGPSIGLDPAPAAPGTTPNLTGPALGATSDKPSSPPSLDEQYVLPRDVLEGPNPEYQPLWDVENSIRLQLAREKAAETIDRRLSLPQDKMREYARTLPNPEDVKKGTAQMPKPLDFQALAQKYGLTFHKTDLLSQYGLTQLEGFGKSNIEGLPVPAFAFDNEHLYVTTRSVDAAGNRYLFWKTADEEARVPEFAEVKSEVLRVWKVEQARKLVREEAQALADKAAADKATLQQAIQPRTDLVVIEPPRFNWLTSGSAGRADERMPARVTDVVGVVDPGDEFMEAVFKLSPGETGVAMNQPKTIAYTVKMLELYPLPAVLREQFLSEATQPGSYMPGLQPDLFKWQRQWLIGQLKAAQVDWLRPAQRQRLMGG